MYVDRQTVNVYQGRIVVQRRRKLFFLLIVSDRNIFFSFWMILRRRRNTLQGTLKDKNDVTEIDRFLVRESRIPFT